MSVNGFEALFQVRQQVFERLLKCHKINTPDSDTPLKNKFVIEDISICDRMYDLNLHMHYGVLPPEVDPESQPDPRQMTIVILQEGSNFSTARIQLIVPYTGALSSQFTDPVEIEERFQGEVSIKFPLKLEDKKFFIDPSRMSERDVDLVGAPSLNDLRRVISLCINDESAGGSGDGRLVNRLSGQIIFTEHSSERPEKIVYDITLFDAAHPLEVLDIDLNNNLIWVRFHVQAKLTFLPRVHEPISMEFFLDAKIPFRQDVHGNDVTWTIFVQRLTEQSFGVPDQEFDPQISEAIDYVANELFGLNLPTDPNSLRNSAEKYQKAFYARIDFTKYANATFHVPKLDNDRLRAEILAKIRSSSAIELLSFKESDFIREISPRGFSNQGLSLGFNGTETPSGAVSFVIPAEQDFSFDIASEVIQPKLDEAAEKGRKKFNDEAGDASLDSLTLSLGTQKFLVHGKGTVSIDCWPDPDFTADGDILVDGVTPNGKMLLSVSDDFDVDIDDDCVTNILLIFSTALFGLLGFVIAEVLIHTLFSKRVASPRDFNDLDEVGQRGLTDRNSAMDLRLLFEDVMVSPSKITFTGRISLECDQFALGIHKIEKVQWNHLRNIIAVKLARTGWQFRTPELIRLMEQRQISIENALIVKGQGGKYLRAPKNEKKSDNLDELPKFVFNRT